VLTLQKRRDISSSLLELVTKVAVKTSGAMGSPLGDNKHLKRYEQLGYSDSMLISLARHLFIFDQTAGLADLCDSE
jgi:hypothetical protein